MAPRTRKTSFVNFLGTLGYLSIVFQWLWAIVIVANPLLSGDMSFFVPINPEPAPPASSTPPSLFTFLLVIILTILIFAFTLYALWKLPRSIGARSGKITKKAAAKLVPIVAHHKPTATERRRLSRRIVQVIKWTLVVLPIAALVFAAPLGELSLGIIWIVGVFCGVCSAIYFGLQQLLATTWKIPPEQVW